MKWVERGTNVNDQLGIQQRPSASIVQPFVWCLAPSVNSLDRTISPLRADELNSPVHSTRAIR
jgi:hypothetical protein